jgi:hypothetical protein
VKTPGGEPSREATVSSQARTNGCRAASPPHRGRQQRLGEIDQPVRRRRRFLSAGSDGLDATGVVLADRSIGSGRLILSARACRRSREPPVRLHVGASVEAAAACEERDQPGAREGVCEDPEHRPEQRTVRYRDPFDRISEFPDEVAVLLRDPRGALSNGS